VAGRPGPPRRPLRALLILVAASLFLTSCAYYNTFYLARRNYDRSLGGLPYAVDKTDVAQGAQFAKSIEYCGKVISQYPKSKWVDDAYLLWARALISNDDPRQALKLLEDFDTHFPNSSLKGDALFYLGVAARQSHKQEEALRSLDAFLAKSPRHSLVPYAQLERARVLMILNRPGEAVQATTAVLDHYSKSPIAVRTRITRGEALFAQKQYERAREDFHFLGTRAASDDDRLDYLLREAECLEAGQKFEVALSLLKNALGHERPPALGDTTGGRPLTVMTTAGYDRYGRLLTRIGTVYLRAGRTDDALAAYKKVIDQYPRTTISAEAQYRIGYAFETVLDDFDRARTEYSKVRDQNSATPFNDQAMQRAASLERLAQFRQKSEGDSLEHKAEAAFMLAEQYLFELDKPERAIEEYRKIEAEFAGTPFEAKAITAEAWTLSRRLKRQLAADSLFWKVVREHAGTEAQLAARDYLEVDGIDVPTDLIKLPEPKLARVDTSQILTRPPQGDTPLGSALTPPRAVGDTLQLGPHASPLTPPPIFMRPPPGPGSLTPSGVPSAPVPTVAARPDTTGGATVARPDSAGVSKAGVTPSPPPAAAKSPPPPPPQLTPQSGPPATAPGSRPPTAPPDTTQGHD
jgi:tetratricopeptide (TPR) repeat protein